MYCPTANKSVQLSQTIQNLYKLAQEKAPGSPAITPRQFHVIALHVLTQEETRSGVQLMAITTNGVRLYFSSSSGPYGYYPGSDTRGQRNLQLVHVRLPPTNLLHPDEQSNPYFSGGAGYPPRYPQAPPTSRPYVLTELENSAHAAGLTIAAHPGDTDGTDFLLCMSPDLTRIGALGQTPPQTSQLTGPPFGAGVGSQRPPLTERAALLAIPGRTWGMAALPRPRNSITLTTPSPNTPMPVVTNELAYQFLEQPRQFLILTNVGITVLAKRRALDWLRDAIEEVQAEGNTQPIIDFRDRYYPFTWIQVGCCPHTCPPVSAEIKHAPCFWHWLVEIHFSSSATSQLADRSQTWHRSSLMQRSRPSTTVANAQCGLNG